MGVFPSAGVREYACSGLYLVVDPGAGTAQSHIHRSLHYVDHEVAKTNHSQRGTWQTHNPLDWASADRRETGGWRCEGGSTVHLDYNDLLFHTKGIVKRRISVRQDGASEIHANIPHQGGKYFVPRR